MNDLIRDVFAPHLVGENCMATEKLWDAMVRLSSAFGAPGLTSYAISAVDCALWDIRGKTLGVPVKLSDTPGAVRTPPVEFGVSTPEILKELGYSENEIKRFDEEGVI